jgi:hypothetical protein
MDPTDSDTVAPPGARAGAPPGALPVPVLDGLDDRGLLDLSAAMQVSENRARAARLEAISDFHARRVAELAAFKAGEPGPWDDDPAYFILTPLQATKSEIVPLLGTPELYVQTDLDLTDDLRRWMPRIWRQCRDGRLDLGYARAVHAHLGTLATDDAREEYAERVEAWMDKHDDPDAPLFTEQRRKLQRAVLRIAQSLPRKSQEETFSELYAKRRVTVNLGDDGIGALSCVTAVHELQRADHRLTLIARRRQQEEGETRTLQQLRADTLFDLVHGRLTVAASEGELAEDCVIGSGCAEHEDGAEDAPCGDPAETFDWSDVGRFARPVVNVTVPITTLMGLGDEPGMLSGGVPIPAELALRIAADPDSVWHRMLTDPAGGFVELSTDAYSPNGVIWRWTAARDVECVHPGCSRAAAVVELDHRVPWPTGKTSTWNIQPLCRKHHLVKHSVGFTVVREVDGSYTWTTRFGTVSRKPPPEYPLADFGDRLEQLMFGPADLDARRRDLDAEEQAHLDLMLERRVLEEPWRDEFSEFLEEHGDEIEQAFREWFEEEVAPTL